MDHSPQLSVGWDLSQAGKSSSGLRSFSRAVPVSSRQMYDLIKQPPNSLSGIWTVRAVAIKNGVTIFHCFRGTLSSHILTSLKPGCLFQLVVGYSLNSSSFLLVVHKIMVHLIIYESLHPIKCHKRRKTAYPWYLTPHFQSWGEF